MSAFNSPLNVVLVDDQPAAIALERRLLSAETTVKVVGEAMDGHQAIEVCDEAQPDAVILDVFLPDMTGFEVARHLLARLPSLRIVLVSSSGVEEGFDVLAREAGATGFLPKSQMSAASLAAFIADKG